MYSRRGQSFPIPLPWFPLRYIHFRRGRLFLRTSSPLEPSPLYTPTEIRRPDERNIFIKSVAVFVMFFSLFNLTMIMIISKLILFCFRLYTQRLYISFTFTFKVKLSEFHSFFIIVSNGRTYRSLISTCFLSTSTRDDVEFQPNC